MRANALLKLGIPLLILLLAIGVFSFARKKPEVTDTASLPVVTIEHDEAKLLGVEGDTANDTLATVVGQMNDVKKSVAALTQQNEALLKENERLRQREASADSRIDARLKKAVSDAQTALSETTKKVEPSLAVVQEKMAGLSGRSDAGAHDEEELPVGLGLQPGDGQAFADGVFNFKISGGTRPSRSTRSDSQPPQGQLSSAPTPEVIWIEPLDAVAVDKKGNTAGIKSVFPNEFKSAALTPVETFNAVNDEYRAKAGREKKGRSENVKPVYTIAENGTLMNATTMTALIGRIPRGGTVTDPFPFKVLIGKDNLMANGIELPDVVGAVVSGDATGDWLLSCVRGQVNSITFIFEDGTIRTVPEPIAKINRSSSSKANAGIGYLSDPFGIPCISGERRHNAAEFLGTTTLMTAIGAAIADQLGGENITYDGNGVMTQQETHKAFDTILTQGFNNANAWVSRLYGETFEAIYVAPAQKVAIHINNEITIDYETQGRKVEHDEKAPLAPADLD